MGPFTFANSHEAFLTVITATYNSSKYIKHCLNSLHLACHNLTNFTDFNIAHLIVDGHSSDQTLDLVKTVSPSSTIVHQKKKGLYDALNQAVYLTESSYLMYLHSDDEMDPNFLVEMSKKIKKFRGYPRAIFYSTVDFIDKNGQVLFSRRPPFYFDAIQKHTALVYHPNAIYSTVLEKKHPYKTNIGLEADQDHIREIAKEAKMVRVSQAKYRFRLSAESSSVQKIAASSYPAINLLARLYIYSFETKLLFRLARKVLGQSSYWSPD